MSMIADDGVRSLKDIEMFFLQVLGMALSDLMKMALEGLDKVLEDKRDKSRYDLIRADDRTIETVLGQPVTFSRRYYEDLEEGGYVYLLDQAIDLEPRTRISPLLRELAIHAGISGPSYRVAAESLARVMGGTVMSHEGVRQQVLKAGDIAEALEEDLIDKADGKRQVDFVFMEADGIWQHLQRETKSKVEEKMVTVHEGWEPRAGNPNEFSLKNSMMFSSHDECDEWWERTARWVYGTYDINEETVVVLGGDRASWIRKASEWFGGKAVLYQVDRFHFVRDIRRIFGKDSESYKKITSVMDVDPTGGLLMQTLVECRVHSSGKKREELDALISDLSTIPDSICDYRVRLRAMGVDTTGLRALGAAESEVNRVSNRTKKQGRSWRLYGLSGIMAVQRAKFSRNLDTVLKRLPEASNLPTATEEEVDEVAAKAIRKVFDSYSRDTGFHPPIMDRGRTASGGMSALFHQLLNGAQFPA